LKKGLYPSEALQRYLSLFIGHQRTRHIYKYIYFPNNVNKKNGIAKKYFLFQGQTEKRQNSSGLESRKKIHSSLLLRIVSAAVLS